MRHENILCVGEFNTTMYPSEKLDRLEDFSESMHEFMLFLRRNYLIDIDLQGTPFTWLNNILGNNVIQLGLIMLLIQ